MRGPADTPAAIPPAAPAAKAAPTATLVKEMSACSSASRGSHAESVSALVKKSTETAIRALRTALSVPRGWLTRLNLGHGNAGTEPQARIVAPVSESDPVRLEWRSVRGVIQEAVDDEG